MTQNFPHVCNDKELAGVVKGPGYLCGCQSCNFSKVRIPKFEFFPLMLSQFLKPN